MFFISLNLHLRLEKKNIFFSVICNSNTSDLTVVTSYAKNLCGCPRGSENNLVWHSSYKKNSFHFEDKQMQRSTLESDESCHRSIQTFEQRVETGSLQTCWLSSLLSLWHLVAVALHLCKAGRLYSNTSLLPVWC